MQEHSDPLAPADSSTLRSGFSRLLAFPVDRLVTIAISVSAALMLFGLTTVAYMLWSDREDLLDGRRGTTMLSATIAEKQVERLFGDVDLQLRAIDDARMLNNNPEALQTFMRARVAVSPDLTVVSILDATGRAVLSSWPGDGFLGADFSTSDYFHAHLSSGKEAGPYIGRVIPSRVTGKWLIGLSRKSARSGPAPLEVLAAGIDTAAIARLFSSLDLGPGSVVTLINQSGIIVARYPDHTGSVGRDVSQTKVFRNTFASAPRGSYIDVSPVDGVKRITSYRSLGSLPLIVATGVNEETALKEWCEQMLAVVLSTAAFAALWLLLTALLVRELRRRALLVQELTVAQEGLDLAQQAAQLGLWTLDLRGSDMTLSKGMYAILGLAKDAFSGSHAAYVNLVHRDDRAGFDRCWRAVLAGEAPLQAEHRIVRPDGSERVVLMTGELLSDAAGTPARISGIVHDITDEVRRRRAHEDAERRYRLLFTDSPLPTWIYDRTTLFLLDVNPAACKLWGHDREVLLAMTVADLNRNDGVAGAMRKARAPAIGDFADNVVTFGRKDGRSVVVEMAACDIELPSGPARLVVGHDITARVDAERAKQAVEARLQSVARATTDLIWDWDLVTGRVWWNLEARTLLGLADAAADFSPDSLESRIHPDDRERVLANLGVARDGSSVEWTAEYRLRRADGGYMTVKDRGELVRDATGKPLRLVCGMEDVTAIRRAEAEIANANERLRFLSGKAREAQEAERARIARELHDSVGQSLTAIKLRLAGATMSGGADAATLQTMLEIVSASIEEVRGMAMDMHPPQLDYLGLKAALEWQLGRQVPADGPRVELNIGELPVLAPQLQVTCFRFVQEAVNNALKHANARTIGVMMRVEANQLYLRVVDDGGGFDPAHAKLDGLGMVGMRERVELAGGTLRVRSAPGHGTELNVELPLHS